MYVLGAILTGFAAAVLAGMFGIGGSSVTTPSLRVILGATPAVALGTTLPVTIPTAAAGAITYLRNGLVDRRVAAFCCAGGGVGAVGGAMLTRVIDLHYLMLVTGAMVLYVSAATMSRGISGRGIESTPPPGRGDGDRKEPAKPADGTGDPAPAAAPGPAGGVRAGSWELAGIGLAAGIFSGLLGVGGGTVMIPAFVYLLKMPLKSSFGTSLTVITVISVPGTVVHSLLGHVSWSLVLYLTAGSVLGAVLGARITIRTPERVLYIMFGVLLAAFGIVFIVNEILSVIGRT